MDIIQKFRMKKNTRHLEITTLNNSIDELNTNMITIIKLIKTLEEDRNDRISKSNTTANENKRTHRGRPKKVCDDKRTID